jgi:hypothetical protein
VDGIEPSGNAELSLAGQIGTLPVAQTLAVLSVIGLVGVSSSMARKDGENFDCGTGLRKAKELPKEGSKERWSGTLRERNGALGRRLFQGLQKSVIGRRESL